MIFSDIQLRNVARPSDFVQPASILRQVIPGSWNYCISCSDVACAARPHSRVRDPKGESYLSVTGVQPKNGCERIKSAPGNGKGPCFLNMTTPPAVVVHATPSIAPLPASEAESIYLAALLAFACPGRWGIVNVTWADNGG